MKRSLMALTVAGSFVLPIALLAQAQQPAASAAGAPAMGIQTPPGKVIIAGENPGIRLLDKEGGTILSQVSFWRANWSPAGMGHVCYITVGDEKAGGLRIAITDNEKLLNYITDFFGKVSAEYKTRPFKTVMGKITTTKWTGSERTENCNSPEYNVDLVWRELDPAASVMNEGRLADSTNPATPFKVTWIRIPARAGDIIINGKKSPGSVYPTGQGPIRGSSASVIFGENWIQ